MSNLPSVLAIETACQSAWPALEEVRDRHWVGRFARGYTKRANSIQSFDASDDGEAAPRLAAMAAHYAARNLPPCYRVTPLTGPGVIAALEAGGWQMFERSLVLAMPLRKLLRPVGALTQGFEPAEPEWLQTQLRLADNEANAENLRAIVGQIKVPARGILAYDGDQQPVGAALAINADGIAIFLNVVVAATARGQGYGRAVMHAALNWASRNGATAAAIQVLADNPAAVPLYRSLGFTDYYEYHYRRPTP